MKITFPDLNIRITFDGISIQIPSIILERLTRTIPSHSHGSGCFEIHYISSGYGDLTADGIHYEITPNTLYITGPHVEHAQTSSQEDPMEEYCIYMKINNRSRQKGSSPVLDAFRSVSFWIGQDHQGIQALMLRLFSELEHKYTGYQNQIELLLSQLLICIVRNYEHRKDFSNRQTTDTLIDHKSRIIEEYFLYEYQSLSLEVLSQRLGLSIRQTQRLLQKYYNKSFQEKKTEARMSAAIILMGDRQRTISSIAEALGYASPEHFSNAFRSFYQTNPREYRRHMDPDPAKE